jgi:hypothetical protein
MKKMTLLQIPFVDSTQLVENKNAPGDSGLQAHPSIFL